jgi:hypothetical protein
MKVDEIVLTEDHFVKLATIKGGSTKRLAT